MNLGVERRFLDDMSEIDIQLQEQTMDISVTEIMKEIENTQLEMNNTKQQINEIQGEEINGK